MTEKPLYREKELLLLIATGDEKAFEVFFNIYSKTLYNFVLRHNDDIQLADDLVQDVFTKMWLTRESLPAIGNVQSYLFSIARNYAIDILRQKVRERKRNIQWHELREPAIEPAQKEIYLSIIDRAIEQLPEQQRKTWIMSRLQKKKYAEIARELGVSKETVKTNRQRANAGISRYVLANVELAVFLILVKFL